jgi:two-component system, cell cycle sensor histidine kinase and response regulator CckA
VTPLAVLLVVDDDAQVRALAARVLSGAGYGVLQCASALEALALLSDERTGPTIRLVVTDIVMPGLHGDDLGRLISRQWPALPLLYMSGHSTSYELDFIPAQELEHRFLAKPFGLDLLVAKVRRLLSRNLAPT